MRFFIAQRVTGEDMDKLKQESEKIISILEGKGHKAYCTILRGYEQFQKKSKKEMMKYAYNEIDNSDVLLVIIGSEDKSEGMLMEVGYVFGKKKKIILLVKEDVQNTYLRDIADIVLEFNDFDDLYNKLREFNF